MTTDEMDALLKTDTDVLHYWKYPDNWLYVRMAGTWYDNLNGQWEYLPNLLEGPKTNDCGWVTIPLPDSFRAQLVEAKLTGRLK